MVMVRAWVGLQLLLELGLGLGLALPLDCTLELGLCSRYC
jgi:hypothetical protein